MHQTRSARFRLTPPSKPGRDTLGPQWHSRRWSAASLAGHLGLDNLCWVYDNNHITIGGNTRIAFTEDIATRFLTLRIMKTFGASAPLRELQRKLGFEPERVVETAKSLLGRR